MYVNEFIETFDENVKNLSQMRDMIARLPAETYVGVSWPNCEIRVQAHGPSQVAAIRQALGHAVWKKVAPRNDFDWWEYLASYGPVKVCIYADREGPVSCRKIVEQITEEVDTMVPAQEVEMVPGKMTITRQVTRWECSPETPNLDHLPTETSADRADKMPARTLSTSEGGWQHA